MLMIYQGGVFIRIKSALRKPYKALQRVHINPTDGNVPSAVQHIQGSDRNKSEATI